MTIKQQGGVFGRNPSFNNVDVETLDVSGATSVGGSLSATNITDNGNTRIIGNTTGTDYNNGSLIIGEDAVGATVVTVGNNAAGNYSYMQAVKIGNQYNTLILNPNGGAVTVGNGNLVFSDGKGIDFSATSGTGTSELFNDYEEGLHNVALTAGTSGSVTVDPTYNTIAYTKVGRVVHIQGRVVVTSVSSPNGYLGISLPFSIASLTQGSGLSAIGLWVTGAVSKTVTEFVSFTQPGTSALRVYFDNGSTTGNGANQMQAGVTININGSYLTS